MKNKKKNISMSYPKNICYLCGSQIAPGEEANEDHVFQKQFMERPQPKTKGYKYASTLNTHKKCNSLFGDPTSNLESICKKALGLIWVLWDAKPLVSKSDPKVKVLGIDVTKHKEILQTLTQHDLSFFQIEGSLKFPTPEHLNPEFWRQKPESAIDPFKKPIEIALSVLAKSAAAYLVKWHNIKPDSFWDFLVIPHFTHHTQKLPDWESVFGKFELLEKDMKIRVIKWPNDDPVVIYQIERMTVIFNFSFPSAAGKIYLKKWIKIWKNDQKFRFKSNQLIDLVGYEWSKHLVNKK